MFCYLACTSFRFQRFSLFTLMFHKSQIFSTSVLIHTIQTNQRNRILSSPGTGTFVTGDVAGTLLTLYCRNKHTVSPSSSNPALKKDGVGLFIIVCLHGATLLRSFLQHKVVACTLIERMKIVRAKGGVVAGYGRGGGENETFC